MQYDIEVKLAPRKAYFDSAQSNSYYATKYARNGITWHWWGGGEQEDKHDSIVNYFLAQGEAQIKSVNYVVSDAKITMMVDPDYVAWCSGPGNPTTISVECEPGLSDEGYKRAAWLAKTLENRYGKTLKFYRHKDWMVTACPGTIDVERIRREADGAIPGEIKPVPTPAPVVPSVPNQGAQTVYLPSYVETWAAYRPYSGYRKGTSDQVGTLLPSKFGGLTYNIVALDGAAAIIDTQAYGRVGIWVKDTEAIIRGTQTYTAPVATQGTVYLPATVETWAVYKVGSQLRKGTSDQVGTILPSKFGGLTYAIIERKANSVVINTQSYGVVEIWVKDTEAVIR